MGIQVIGLKAVRASLAAGAAKLRRRMKSQLEEAGEVLAPAVQRYVTGAGLVRTGTLLRSIRSSVRNLDQSTAELTVGPDRRGFYGKFHEDGTATLRKRPFLQPALDEKEERVRRIIGRSLDVVVR